MSARLIVRLTKLLTAIVVSNFTEMLARVLNEDCLEHILSMCEPETIEVLRYVPELVPSSLLKRYATTEEPNVLRYSLTNNYPGLLGWSLQMGKVLNDGMYIIAAYHGSLEVLKWMYEHHPKETCHCFGDKMYGPLLCSYSAEQGHLHVLKWLRTDIPSACVWDWSTCTEAARGNRLEVLRWAVDNGCKWNPIICMHAATRGQLEILKYAVSSPDRCASCVQRIFVCPEAARCGHLDILKWAKGNGLPWNYTSIYSNSSPDTLKWLKDQGLI